MVSKLNITIKTAGEKKPSPPPAPKVVTKVEKSSKPRTRSQVSVTKVVKKESTPKPKTTNVTIKTPAKRKKPSGAPPKPKTESKPKKRRSSSKKRKKTGPKKTKLPSRISQVVKFPPRRFFDDYQSPVKERWRDLFRKYWGYALLFLILILIAIFVPLWYFVWRIKKPDEGPLNPDGSCPAGEVKVGDGCQTCGTSWGFVPCSPTDGCDEGLERDDNDRCEPTGLSGRAIGGIIAACFAVAIAFAAIWFWRSRRKQVEELNEENNAELQDVRDLLNKTVIEGNETEKSNAIATMAALKFVFKNRDLSAEEKERALQVVIRAINSGILREKGFASEPLKLYALLENQGYPLPKADAENLERGLAITEFEGILEQGFQRQTTNGVKQTDNFITLEDGAGDQFLAQEKAKILAKYSNVAGLDTALDGAQTRLETLRKRIKESRNYANDPTYADTVDEIDAVLSRSLRSSLAFEDLIGLPPGADVFKDPNFGRGNNAGQVAIAYGPPGTGKTAIAEALSNEPDTEVVVVGRELKSDVEGGTEKNIAVLFDQLRQKQVQNPDKRYILLLDEVDKITKGAPGIQQMLLTKLQEYTGDGPKGKTVNVIMTTNNWKAPPNYDTWVHRDSADAEPILPAIVDRATNKIEFERLSPKDTASLILDKIKKIVEKDGGRFSSAFADAEVLADIVEESGASSRNIDLSIKELARQGFNKDAVVDVKAFRDKVMSGVNEKDVEYKKKYFKGFTPKARAQTRKDMEELEKANDRSKRLEDAKARERQTMERNRETLSEKLERESRSQF